MSYRFNPTYITWMASLIEFEGNYEDELTDMCAHRHLDENGLSWYSRQRGNEGYHTFTVPDDVDSITEINFECDAKGLWAFGKMWIDDVSLKRENNGGFDEMLLNRSFETPGTGGNTFSNWTDPNSDIGEYVEINPDTEVYRDDGIGDDATSCRIERVFTGNIEPIDIDPDPDEEEWILWETPLTQFHNPSNDPILSGEKIKISGYVRTRELDTMRLACPWQWNWVGMWYVKPENPGRYLGTTNKAGPLWMPMDEGLHFRWKRLVGTIGVAEWAWTPNFPKEHWLKDLWFKPFMMCEKEVTW